VLVFWTCLIELFRISIRECFFKENWNEAAVHFKWRLETSCFEDLQTRDVEFRTTIGSTALLCWVAEESLTKALAKKFSVKYDELFTNVYQNLTVFHFQDLLAKVK
jgi:hypothetical protein